MLKVFRKKQLADVCIDNTTLGKYTLDEVAKWLRAGCSHNSHLAINLSFLGKNVKHNNGDTHEKA